MHEVIDHPFPQERRKEWMDLNGEWDFSYDDGDVGLVQGWTSGFEAQRPIMVPFVHQAKLSGIGDTRFHPIVWYQRNVEIDELGDDSCLLHFEGVDYSCTIWVNGHYAGEHVGGNSRFCVDATAFMHPGENNLILRVIDDLRDMTIPRGKQYWKEKAEVMWFTPMTGIWRDVWLERRPKRAIENLRITPHIDDETVELDIRFTQPTTYQSMRLAAYVTFEGETVVESISTITGRHVRMRIGLDDFNDHGLGRWWSPDHPNIYDLRLVLLDEQGTSIDEMLSYFGMREVAIVNGKYCLNHRPVFLSMVLDQGYFPESLLTSPSPHALERDVALIKNLGFNGVRKHMMACSARYAHLCDVYGVMLWSEMAAAYDYSEEYASRMMDEWRATVIAGYNHPSIVTWVPLNESWGVPDIYYSTQQQAHANSLVYLAKSLDDTRPVISNDGWEHCHSDLFTVHDYSSDCGVLKSRYADVKQIISDMPGLEGRKFLFCSGYSYEGQPVMVTEMGGMNYRLDDFGDPVEPRFDNSESWLNAITEVVRSYQDSRLVQGICYTQLTDTQTEICGLLTWNREPKVSIERLHALFAARKV